MNLAVNYAQESEINTILEWTRKGFIGGVYIHPRRTMGSSSFTQASVEPKGGIIVIRTNAYF